MRLIASIVILPAYVMGSVNFDLSHTHAELLSRDRVPLTASEFQWKAAVDHLADLHHHQGKFFDAYLRALADSPDADRYPFGVNPPYPAKFLKWFQALNDLLTSLNTPRDKDNFERFHRAVHSDMGEISKEIQEWDVFASARIRLFHGDMLRWRDHAAEMLGSYGNLETAVVLENFALIRRTAEERAAYTAGEFASIRKALSFIQNYSSSSTVEQQAIAALAELDGAAKSIEEIKGNVLERLETQYNQARALLSERTGSAADRPDCSGTGCIAPSSPSGK